MKNSKKRVYCVFADTIDEAEQKMQDQYPNEKVILLRSYSENEEFIFGEYTTFVK